MMRQMLSVYLKKVTLVLVAVLLAACNEQQEAAVDKLFAEYAAPGMPGAAVMVIRQGKPVLAKGYGLANVEQNTPVTTASNFRLASISKQFTATAVLILVDEGKVQLDDSIREYFPEFPSFMQAMTVRHFLQHNSGVIDYEPLYTEQLPSQITDEGVVEILAQADETYFSAGSDYRYSNSAYAALAVLVERVSGQSFAAFLKQHIFEPAGMQNTVAFQHGVSTVSHRAMGYRVEDGEAVFSDQSPWSAVLGDGGIYTSLEDLYRWDQLQYNNTLLSGDMQKAMTEPGLEDYGFGLWINDYKGHRRYYHSGSTSGFRNFMQRFPELELTIIVLTNRAAPDVEPLAEQVADIFLP